MKTELTDTMKNALIAVKDGMPFKVRYVQIMLSPTTGQEYVDGASASFLPSTMRALATRGYVSIDKRGRVFLTKSGRVKVQELS